MERRDKIHENKAKNLILTGICRCGKTFNTALELPETITVQSGNSVFQTKLAEHLIITCPCGRLVNLGNGTRRAKKGIKKWRSVVQLKGKPF